VAAYLAHEAERGSAPSTITRRCAAIRYAHRLADLEPPTASEHVRATLRGIRHAIGVAPDRKAPLLAEQARAMADAVPANLKGLRDRALLLLGFAGAFRRSEVVALDVADLHETDDGFRVLIRRSKTDQEGRGETIAIVRGHRTCPVKAVKAWLSAAGITEGPLFRPVAKGGRLSNRRLTDKSVCDIVKTYAGRLGLNAPEFSAHSLRADSSRAPPAGARQCSRCETYRAINRWTFCRPMSAMPTCSRITPESGFCDSATSTFSKQLRQPRNSARQ
jgi:integrase